MTNANLLMPYRLDIFDKDGNKIAEVPHFRNLKMSRKLNKINTLDFALHLEDEQATKEFLSVEKNQIKLLKYNEISDLYIPIWGGIIKDVTLKFVAQTVVVHCEDYLTFLEDRYVEYENPSGVNKATFCADLIFDSMTKGSFFDMGITIGTIQTGQTSTITDEIEGKNIYKIIESLSNTEDGFDFEIDENKRFNTYSPRKGIVKTDVLFELSKNIEEATIKVEGNNLVNRYILIGENGIRTEVNDLGSQSEFFVRESLKKFREVTSVDLLDGIGEEAVSLNRSAQQELNIQLTRDSGYSLFDFEEGDQVRVKGLPNDEWFGFDNFIRIRDVNLSLDDQQNEKINIIIFRER